MHWFLPANMTYKEKFTDLKRTLSRKEPIWREIYVMLVELDAGRDWGREQMR